ncbi:MAG: ATP synthase F1 subunit gamma [Anaerolineales bacterium]|nr:MAG: ATP synthase F1 subunit gamma [Anaerolineales bacterium]
MASAREMRLRIRSVENIAQVTRALQAVSASRVRKAEARVKQTRPYADKAWQVLRHLSVQPAKGDLHPFLQPPELVKNVIAVVITGDRGLAGAYNTNILRYTLENFSKSAAPVKYVVVGRKGRDTLIRRRVDILAEFSDLPAEPTFADVSAVGSLVMDEFVSGRADQVFLVYTDFVNFIHQIPRHKLLLPVSFEELPIGENSNSNTGASPQREAALQTYFYEPSQEALISQIVPRLTELQVYQAITESLASEHAARMVAMQNATDNAFELAGALRLEYNKARQQAITSDMLDIAGGAEALTDA